MLQVFNLTKTFGRQVIFEDVSFSISPRERVGLVGRNGHGKTTMLRMITGEEHPDSGELSVPRNYRVGLMSQQFGFTQGSLLAEACLGLPADDAGETWRAEKVLSGLGFSASDMARPPAEFSGGYQVRLNLAKVLVSEPHLLLLDEPTNFLDIVSIRWLASYLRTWPGEVMLVTHDRSFMDSVVTHTLGIHRKKIRKMAGTTDKYYEQIAKDEEIYEKTRLNDEKKRKDAELFISRFRAKARLAGLVQSRIKALERSEKLDRLEHIETLEFSFEYRPFSAKVVMNANELAFGFGNEPLFSGLSLTIGAGDRVCVIGKNGRGKTTLLRLLAGELVPQRGEILPHASAAAGYFAQSHTSDLNQAFTVEEEIMSAGCERQKARDICGAMMFSGDSALKKISVLSGGEKSRVLLGRILASPSNMLLLDEPTNHLDMESSDALLAAVDAFPGAVVMVTHNEMFLRALATRFVVFQAGGASVFEGTYDDFLSRVGWEDERERQAEKKGDMTAGGGDRKELRKRRAELVARRSRELKPMETRMAAIEKQIGDAEKELEIMHARMIEISSSGDGKAIQALSVDIHRVKSSIDALYDELDALTREYEHRKDGFDRELGEL